VISEEKEKEILEEDASSEEVEEETNED